MGAKSTTVEVHPSGAPAGSVCFFFINFVFCVAFFLKKKYVQSMSTWSMNECSHKSYTYTLHVGTDPNKIFFKVVGVGFEVHTVPVIHSTFPFDMFERWVNGEHTLNGIRWALTNGDSELWANTDWNGAQKQPQSERWMICKLYVNASCKMNDLFKLSLHCVTSVISKK